MTLETLKEQLTEKAIVGWRQFKDSSLYSQISETYENASPVVQKLMVVGAIVLPVWLVASLPWGYFSSSQTTLQAYQEKRALLRDLHKTNREVTGVSQFPPTPELSSLQASIMQILDREKVLPEQRLGIEIAALESSLVPNSLMNGALTVKLVQLTMKQLIELSNQIESSMKSTGLANPVKMTDLKIQKNKTDARYIDVDFSLVLLKAPEAIVARAPEKGAKNKKEDE